MREALIYTPVRLKPQTVEAIKKYAEENNLFYSEVIRGVLEKEFNKNEVKK